MDINNSANIGLMLEDTSFQGDNDQTQIPEPSPPVDLLRTFKYAENTPYFTRTGFLGNLTEKEQSVLKQLQQYCLRNGILLSAHVFLDHTNTCPLLDVQELK